MNRTKHLGLSLLALLCCIVVTAQTTAVTKCEYWIDQQFDSRKTANMSAGELTTQLDMSALPTGLHSLAIRTGTDDDRWSAALVKYFLVPEPGSTQENNLAGYEYWIDGNYANRVSGTFSEGGIVTTDIDVSTLPVGLHSISFRALDDNGHVSSVLVKFFLVPEPGSTQENNLAGYEYWIDGDYDNKVSGTFSEGGIITTDLDMSTLPIGLHSLSFRALDDNGHVSSVLVKFFLVPENTSTTENELTGYRYWFDRDMENAVEGEMTSEGVIETDIDASALIPGLHLFNYQVKDALGKYSATVMSFFTVPEEGALVGDKIVAYEYWFNDNPRKKVEVEPTATLELNDIDLEVEGVEPETVPADYAFNAETKQVVYTVDVEFGLQVFNNQGTGSAAATQTIVGHQLFMDTQMQTLTGEQAITLPAPTGNKVQGYQFNCSVGDKLYWFMDLAEGTTVDFYDADGVRIAPEAIGTETVGDKEVTTLTATTPTVYALMYGATGTEAQNTVKVALPVSITVNDAEREYGDENPQFTYSSEQAALIIGTPLLVTDATETSPVGDYAVTIDLSSIGNSVVTITDGKLTITKAMLTVTADDKVRDWGEENPELTYTISGWKGSDDETSITTLPTAYTNATIDSEAGEYAITVSGGVAQNYDFVYVDGKLTINEPTGVKRILNGDFTKPVDVYNMQGVKVRSGVTSLDELPQGTYIIMGRKVNIVH